MVKIIFVSGPPGVGKTTYISNNFKDTHRVDLFEFQKHFMFLSYDSVWQSYLDCLEATKKAIKMAEEDGKDVVMEHTLLKAPRRQFYIEELRKVTNAPIEMIFMTPAKEEYVKRAKEKGLDFDEEECEKYLNFAEIPKIEEGYSKVTILTE